MKKVKGTIIFIGSCLLILLFEFCLYRNLDEFMPTYENRLYSFDNDTQKQEKEFLFEMYEQIELQNKRYKSITEEEIQKISENKILSNIIKEYIFKDIEDEEFKQISMEYFYSEELYNTIYGDLKIIGSIYIEPSFIILYSEEMNKLYYINLNQVERSKL